MIPESKSLHLHELVHRQMPGLETRPDMSIKVGCESHDMRIGAMIVGVRSTKQSSGIIIDCICSQQE